MSDIDARLREDVHLLGELLGNTIREQYGEAFLDKIEQIRKGAKADRRGAVSEKTAGDELSTSRSVPSTRQIRRASSSNCDEAATSTR